MPRARLRRELYPEDVNELQLPWCSRSKEPAHIAGDLGSTPGWGRSLEKGMAAHSSVLAWRIRGHRRLKACSPLVAEPGTTT